MKTTLNLRLSPKLLLAPLSGERLWLFFALVTTLFWGVWGAFIELPEKAGFPATLGYSVWALTMIPCALIALRRSAWKLNRDGRSVLFGSLAGFLGAGGQSLLFLALRTGPAYLVFPIISLYPVVTVFLSVVLLKERASRRAWTGIACSMPAIVMVSWQPPGGAAVGHLWLLLALTVFLLWGAQAYLMKFANTWMSAESVFFYMAATGVVLIPLALMMTNFSKPINWGLRGPYLAAGIQLLNSIGALTLVFALRFGKAIIVVPLTALAPVLITIVLSLVLYQVVPNSIVAAGMVLASVAIYLMAE